jgi:hypothetical protein
MTEAGHRRQMIGTSLSIGLCVRCLEEAMHDGRVHRSPTMLSTMAVSDQPAPDN